MQGYSSFESWDETYVHTLHNKRTERSLSIAGRGKNLSHGLGFALMVKGVFYTAWGHDGRTFGNEGFHNLVERGIRWACSDDPSVVPEYEGVKPEPLANLAMTRLSQDVEPFDYVDVGPKIPNYVDTVRNGVSRKSRELNAKTIIPEESIKHYSVPEGFD